VQHIIVIILSHFRIALLPCRDDDDGDNDDTIKSSINDLSFVLLCGHSKRPQYASGPSVCLHVCLSVCPNWKTKRRRNWKTKIGLKVPATKRCANFQLRKSKIGARVSVRVARSSMHS